MEKNQLAKNAMIIMEQIAIQWTELIKKKKTISDKRNKFKRNKFKSQIILQVGDENLTIDA